MKTRFAVLAAGIAILMGMSCIAAAAECDRACLNDADLTLPEGLWCTVGSVGVYRLIVADPKEGSTGSS